MRLNKYVAQCGVCSRRAAAELVKKGEISLNGTVEKNPAVIVESTDKVSYKGKVLALELNKVYLLLNKPKNTVTTVKDEQGRKTVMDLVKNKAKERIYPVGRLDRNTTGLLLLTNDGDLAKKLSHPSHEVKKIYEVHLNIPLDPKHLEAIKKGITLEDGIVQVDTVNFIKGRPTNEIGIEIHIGRNRIVRRIFEHFDYTVVRLDRVYYAGLTKKDLPRGFSRHLSEQELIMLKHFT